MSNNNSRQSSRQASRRNSAQSEYDDWYDGDDVQRPWPEKMGQLIHDQSAAINMALKTTATEAEKEQARKEAKKRIGSEAIRETISMIEPSMDNKFEKLITKRRKRETLPSFNFANSENSTNLNSIIKRTDKIYEGKLTYNDRNWISFLKFVIKEQQRNKLSQDDVIEILRIKLDPYDFEIFETRVEVDGFFKAFDYLRKTYIARPANGDKIKAFHQHKLQFQNMAESLRVLQKKATYAFPKFTYDQIDEKIFDYILVNIKGAMLDKIIDEDEKRNDLIEAGFHCEKLRGEELFDFMETYVKENMKRTFVRNVNSEKEEKDLSNKFKQIWSKLDENEKTQKMLVNNVESMQQNTKPNYSAQKNNENDNKKNTYNKNKGNKNNNRKETEVVHSGGPNYKAAVAMLYNQNPLDKVKDVFFYINKITNDQNRRFRNKITVREKRNNWKPKVEWVGDKYKPDSPAYNGPIFKTQDNRAYLTYNCLQWFNKRCIACGLTTCYDPYGTHCPGRGYEITWSICGNCNRSYHKTAECKVYLEETKN